MYVVKTLYTLNTKLNMSSDNAEQTYTVHTRNPRIFDTFGLFHCAAK